MLEESTRRFALLLCLLPTGLAAQQQLVSPAGAAKQEGADAAYIFGRYAEARYQFFEGDLRGSARTLLAASYRLDYRDHDARTATGRSWSQVSLRLADCDYDKVSAQWDNNATSTPALVFSGSVSWPTQVGQPLIKPAIWGSLSRELEIPFSQPYSFGGTADLLLDYEMSGGVMKNGATWTFTSPFYYYLDGEQGGPGPRDGLVETYPVTGNCADSTRPQTPGARSEISARVYADNDPDPSKAGRLELLHSSLDTAPNSPVIQAVGLRGWPAGVDIGAACNRLYVDLTTVWFGVYAITDATGSSGRSPGSGSYSAPFVAQMGGEQVWTQAAWTDSRTGAFSLGRAARVLVPSSKPLGMVPRKKVAYHYLRTLPIAFAPTAASEANPFLMLSYR